MGLRKRISDALYQLGPGRYYQPTYRNIADAIGLTTGSFLDVGCGPGWLCTHVAAGKLNIDATGIDHSPQMVEAARRNTGVRPNITVREMQASSIKFPEHTFDAVAAVQTAHHWKEPDKILAEIHRVLKSGGRFFLYEADKANTSVPDGWIRRTLMWPPDVLVLNGWRRFGMDDDEWASMEVRVRKLGFRSIRLDRHGFYRRMVLTK